MSITWSYIQFFKCSSHPPCISMLSYIVIHWIYNDFYKNNILFKLTSIGLNVSKIVSTWKAFLHIRFWNSISKIKFCTHIYLFIRNLLDILYNRLFFIIVYFLYLFHFYAYLLTFIIDYLFWYFLSFKYKD